MTPNNEDLRTSVLRTYGGQWVAWNQEQTKVVASGRTFEEVNAAAEATGERRPLFEKIPKPDTRLVGTR
jgi:hypothetical protein